jgi:hypothetical protein
MVHGMLLLQQQQLLRACVRGWVAACVIDTIYELTRRRRPGRGAKNTSSYDPTTFFNDKRQECEKEIADLKTFVELLKSPQIWGLIQKQVQVQINTHSFHYDPTLKDWWLSTATNQDITKFLYDIRKNHKYGNKDKKNYHIWHVGCVGSVWCDTEFNGKWCRLALYFQTPNDPNDPNDRTMVARWEQNTSSRLTQRSGCDAFDLF